MLGRMNAMSSDFTAGAIPLGAAPPGSAPGVAEPVAASAMGLKWSALLDAAGVVATLAGFAAEPLPPHVRDFPATMQHAGGWRLQLAEQGVADLAAIMEPGIAALLAVHARGADPVPAARALWQEFQAACAALLALAPPGDA